MSVALPAVRVSQAGVAAWTEWTRGCFWPQGSEASAGFEPSDREAFSCFCEKFPRGFAFLCRQEGPARGLSIPPGGGPWHPDGQHPLSLSNEVPSEYIFPIFPGGIIVFIRSYRYFSDQRYWAFHIFGAVKIPIPYLSFYGAIHLNWIVSCLIFFRLSAIVNVTTTVSPTSP